MASTTTATAASSSGIRHSARQTRTNPSRISKTVGRSSLLGQNAHGHGANTAATNNTHPHGFYPAITHFTDAIAALPREFRRHTSLLKEVDGKAWALEENLSQSLKSASLSPSTRKSLQGTADVNDNSGGSQKSDPAHVETAEITARRKLFYDIRVILSELMLTTDEKNHVLWNANSELQKQLFRLDTIYPYVEGEVSEEARLGSLSHWAYSNKTTAKAAGPTGTERTRREVAAASNLTAVLHDADAALRSESRREAMIARKHRRNQGELEADEGRIHGPRKGSATGGLASSAAPAKRRKVEKPQPVYNATIMERSASAANATAGRAASKEASATEMGKKRIRAPNAASTAGRKRTNTTASATGSPMPASSPVASTFPAAAKAASPVPNTSQRPPSSRTQQVSAQLINGRQRPSSSASIRVSNAIKSIADTKSSATKDSNSTMLNPEPASATTGANGETHAGSSTASKPADPGLKREEANPGNGCDSNATKTEPQAAEPIAPAIQPKGRSSKTSTPVVSTFAESQRSRPSRTDGPAKRSHKKGASLVAAQQVVLVPATEDEDSSRQGDDEDDEGEPRYCYCNQVSFGEMVACDMENCPREWFHLSCVGLSKPPLKSAKWYCNECKEALRKGKSGNGK